MCEKCNSLMGCNIHLCPTASRQLNTDPSRSAPTLRLPTDTPRAARTTPRIQSTIPLLDIASKQ